jgi:hypothetical protein
MYIDGIENNGKSQTLLTGSNIEFRDIEIDDSLETTYHGREFALTEIQDRTQEDHSGILLFKFSPKDGVCTEGGLNGMNIYAINRGDNRLEYLAQGTTMQPTAMSLLQGKNPYIELEKDLRVVPRGKANNIVNKFFQDIKHMIEKHRKKAINTNIHFNSEVN